MSIARQATLADAPALAAIHKSCFFKPWSAGEFQDLMNKPGAFAFLVPEMAFGLFRVAADECEILSIATLKPVRGKGYAKAILDIAGEYAFKAGALQMFLEVDETNEAARALYKSMGFAEVGRRKGYYRESGGPTDALVLRAELPLQK